MSISITSRPQQFLAHNACSIDVDKQAGGWNRALWRCSMAWLCYGLRDESSEDSSCDSSILSLREYWLPCILPPYTLTAQSGVPTKTQISNWVSPTLPPSVISHLRTWDIDWSSWRASNSRLEPHFHIPHYCKMVNLQYSAMQYNLLLLPHCLLPSFQPSSFLHTGLSWCPSPLS